MANTTKKINNSGTAPGKPKSRLPKTRLAKRVGTAEGARTSRLGLKIAIPVVAVVAVFGGLSVLRSSAAQSEEQRFATEMYQRCYNTMKTSGSDHKFWTDYIIKNGATQAWSAFVAAANKNGPVPCSYPYPPLTTNSTVQGPVDNKRQPTVNATDYVAEANNRLKLSNAFVENSKKELESANSIANIQIVEKTHLDQIAKKASDVASWIEKSKNYQDDIKSYIDAEPNAAIDNQLKQIRDQIIKNQAIIQTNLHGILAAYEKAVSANKAFLDYVTPDTPSTPTGVVGADQVTSPSACSISGGVHTSIVGMVNNMCSAAASAGVSLSGSGWRSTERQIQLRRQHCGTSEYAIWNMAASSCRPPTAIPGRSMHEKGLAIDFSNCGRGSACFNWLRNNASRFGFYNLPSETWHWSTDGS